MTNEKPILPASTNPKDYAIATIGSHSALQILKGAKDEGIKSIAMVIAERKIKNKHSVERRCYITSLEPNAEKIGHSIRSHWSIENSLHWQLDVNFKEDQSRLRTKNGAENFAAIRRMALSMLKQETTKKLSMKCKRLLAGWDSTY